MAYGSNLLTNPGFETGDGTGWTTSGTATVRNYNVRSGTYSLGYGTANYTAYQAVDISAYATAIDAGNVNADILIYTAFSGASEGDSWRVRLQYLNSASAVIAEVDSGTITTPNTGYVLKEDIRVCPSGTRYLRIYLYGTEGGSTNTDVYFDDASITIELIVVPLTNYLNKPRRSRFPGSITGI